MLLDSLRLVFQFLVAEIKYLLNFLIFYVLQVLIFQIINILPNLLHSAPGILVIRNFLGQIFKLIRVS